MRKKINTELVLQAILAEYTVRTTDIQNRKGAEDTLFQIHITTITALLAGIFTIPLGQWLIFLLPIEATLFGWMWFGNSLEIMRNGKYIRELIEPRVALLLGQERVVGWETTQREKVLALSEKKINTPYWLLIFITFAGPSIIAIFYATILIAISINIQYHLLPLPYLQAIKPIYTGANVVLSISCLLIDIIFFILFLTIYSYRMKMFKK